MKSQKDVRFVCCSMFLALAACSSGGSGGDGVDGGQPFSTDKATDEPEGEETGTSSSDDGSDTQPVDSGKDTDTGTGAAPMECDPGDSRITEDACGFNGNGKTIESCNAKGRWVVAKNIPQTAEDESCDDTDECPYDFTQFEACGEGDAGVHGRICGDGLFADWGECIIQEEGWDYSEGMIGWGEGKFSFVQWLALDAQGNVYTTEPGARECPTLNKVEEGRNRVQKFDATMAFQSVFGWAGAPVSERYDDMQWNQNAEGVAIDREAGIVYVIDGYEKYDDGAKSEKIGNHRVLSFTTNGEFLGLWGEDRQLGDDAYLASPTDMTMDADGNLLIVDADPYAPGIKKFDTSGNLIVDWADGGVLRGNADGDFGVLGGIGLDGEGNLYVANTFGCSIDKFDAAGAPVERLGRMEHCGVDKFREWYPFDVAVGEDGAIYVSLIGYVKAVHKLTAGGAFVTEIVQVAGEEGDLHPSSFFIPRAVVVEGDRLFVVDGARGVFVYGI